ncbi:hypothetical protein EKK58_09865 [Candidatus Dependentiae bacterium]|nr:MAG: hypothetical protein EKK58_09865 [Candidatus Dependentiae bacterium]
MNDNLNYSALFNSQDGQLILNDLIEKFYTPMIKQDNVNDTYFRLGQIDTIAFILARIETSKLYILNTNNTTGDNK